MNTTPAVTRIVMVRVADRYYPVTLTERGGAVEWTAKPHWTRTWGTAACVHDALVAARDWLVEEQCPERLEDVEAASDEEIEGLAEEDEPAPAPGRVVVAGGPRTGKSTLAKRIAGAHGLAVRSTDA